jgi:hypothetical protein
MSLGDITTDTMRTAFAQNAKTHEAATIQRCWSTWNVLCMFLYTSELIARHPDAVGRPARSRASDVCPDTVLGHVVTALGYVLLAARIHTADHAPPDFR